MGEHRAGPALESHTPGDSGDRSARAVVEWSLAQPVELDDVVALRGQLSALRSLLVLSMLMTESGSDAHILRLTATAATSLASCRAWGARVGADWRLLLVDPAPGERTTVERQLRDLGEGGGRLEIPGLGWGYAYPLRGLSQPEGHLVVGASTPPSAEEQFLLRALAQQAGVAFVNARLHAQERATAEQLSAANASLQETVTALRRRMEIHERLTEVVLSGGGVAGIAAAVHEVTGHPTAIEDRHGNLQAWAGSDPPQPYPKNDPSQRARLLRRAARSGGPVRSGDRVIAVARPRDEVLGAIVLLDPAGSAGDHDLIALEHGATVLAMELAHLRSLAESELRRTRDLVDELLTEPDRERTLVRAQALGYDLERPHRVVVVAAQDAATGHEGLLERVCSVARSFQDKVLAAPVQHGVALLTDSDLDWTRLRASLTHELGSTCHLGVGGVAGSLDVFPRSYRQACLALKLQEARRGTGEVRPFDGLGVYRLLAAVEDPADVEEFVHDWLGDLIDYDERHSYELVLTLARYLEHGGQYDATAGVLNVHRNTLKYRLRRLQEISGHDLRDPFTRFNLQLATSAWETLQAMDA